jgi:hypothetical protein
MLRTLLLAAAGLFLMFGSVAVGYEGSGPLACIIASFVASNGWKSSGKVSLKNNVHISSFTLDFPPLQDHTEQYSTHSLTVQIINLCRL